MDEIRNIKLSLATGFYTDKNAENALQRLINICESHLRRIAELEAEVKQAKETENCEIFQLKEDNVRLKEERNSFEGSFNSATASIKVLEAQIKELQRSLVESAHWVPENVLVEATRARIKDLEAQITELQQKLDISENARENSARFRDLAVNKLKRTEAVVLAAKDLEKENGAKPYDDSLYHRRPRQLWHSLKSLEGKEGYEEVS